MTRHGEATQADEVREDVLQRRALVLADRTEEDRGLTEVLAFVAAGGRYLVALSDVVEVVEGSPLARVPLAGPPLLGVATLRSSLLPVLELGPGVAGDRTAPAWLLVLGGPEDRTGVAVDELAGVELLDPTTLVDPAEGRHPGPVKARRRDGAGLLDVQALLADDDRASPDVVPQPSELA